MPQFKFVFSVLPTAAAVAVAASTVDEAQAKVALLDGEEHDAASLAALGMALEYLVLGDIADAELRPQRTEGCAPLADTESHQPNADQTPPGSDSDLLPMAALTDAERALIRHALEDLLPDALTGGEGYTDADLAALDQLRARWSACTSAPTRKRRT